MSGSDHLVVDGYVRVSRVGKRHGERFISPAVQREQIFAWADRADARVLEVFEELDESGGRRDRPLLERAVRRIETGISQGLVVARTDRFGRSLLHGLVMIDRIQKAGGRFVSVRDGLVANTDASRLVLRIMLSMGEFDLERQQTAFDIAKAKAIQRGVYMGCYVPLGYQKTAAGRLTPDPEIAPLIRKMFRRRAAGDSIGTLRAWMESQGVPTPKGNSGWSTTFAANLLHRRVYLGEVSHGPYVREDAHPALIDAVTWELAQRPRHVVTQQARKPTLLRGLVRCASCGMTMSRYGTARDPSADVYGCRSHFAAGSCPRPASISAIPLEVRAETMMFNLLGERRRIPEARLRTAEQRAEATRRSLATYRDSAQLLNALGERAFAEGLAVRTRQLRDARLQVAAIRAKVATHALPPTPQLRRDWRRMSIDERRATLAAVIDCVFISPGRGDYDHRISVCPAGTAPAGLPRRGDKRPTLRAYPHRREWVHPYEKPLRR